jgi:hypothetical protein
MSITYSLPFSTSSSPFKGLGMLSIKNKKWDNNFSYKKPQNGCFLEYFRYLIKYWSQWSGQWLGMEKIIKEHKIEMIDNGVTSGVTALLMLALKDNNIEAFCLLEKVTLMRSGMADIAPHRPDVTEPVQIADYRLLL